MSLSDRESRTIEKPKRIVPTHHHVVAGLSGGAVATLVTHPLDLVKTRLQVQHASLKPGEPPMYSGTIHALRTIGGQEGLKGLYRGLNPSLIGASVSWGAYFGLFHRVKRYLSRFESEKSADSTHVTLHLASGLVSGMTTAFLTNPIWLVSARMKLAVPAGHKPVGLGSHNYRGVGHALRSVWMEEGLRGLYKGLVPSLWGTSHGAVQFMVYEELKTVVKSNNGGQDLGPVESLAVGACAKVAASTSTYPYQVIRARLQDEHIPKEGQRTMVYRGFVDCARKVYQAEGIAGFYRGLVPNTIRVMPGAAVTFMVYEQVVKWYGDDEGDDDEV